MMTNTKKTIPVLLVVLGLLAGLVSGCGFLEEYTVSFDCGGIADQTVRSGQRLAPVEAPTREGYVFDGWYQDQLWTKPWNLQSDQVSSNMKLYAGWDKDTGGQMASSGSDKDFSGLRTPGSQEEAYDYTAFFCPELDGSSQPYVGDPMPYYEDGTYYIYYLKEAGDSYNHSIYLATTQDFVTYQEYDEPILESSRSGGQDLWVGTGSVVKVHGRYYFFYSGHNGAATMEYKEKILLAVGDTPTSFEKVEGWELIPPAELRQKNDFRDPQVYYDAETDTITMTVTAPQDGVARVLKFTLSSDLQTVTYDGIIFTDPTQAFWNLECTDTFRMGDTWYLTYSGQDDTLWYASSSEPYGPYGEAKRLDGKLFYASKHVDDGENYYMVGWARRSESPSSTQDVSAWGGNLAVQKLLRLEDGSLALAPVEALEERLSLRRPLAVESTHIGLSAGSLYQYQDAFPCYERLRITGEFTFTGSGSFGLAFDYNGRAEKYKLLALSPGEDKIKLLFNEGSVLISETAAELEAGKCYCFTYIQEGSVGVFYLDGEAALTIRVYGVSGKPIRLFAENNDVLFSALRLYTDS